MSLSGALPNLALEDLEDLEDQAAPAKPAPGLRAARLFYVRSETRT